MEPTTGRRLSVGRSKVNPSSGPLIGVCWAETTPIDRKSARKTNPERMTLLGASDGWRTWRGRDRFGARSRQQNDRYRHSGRAGDDRNLGPFMGPPRLM